MSLAEPEAVETPELDVVTELDVSHLVTEDDTPVDSIFSQSQMRLLTEPLLSSWRTERSFVALSNVGLFSAINRPPVVPDVLLSLDVSLPENTREKANRCYFLWLFGKAPDVVIEIVSNKEGGEADRKVAEYARIGVPYYAIFDPDLHIMPQTLTFYELRGGRYVTLPEAALPGRLLTLVPWEGEYEGDYALWLRWADGEGNLIPTGAELAKTERQRAETEHQRAEAEHARAEALAAKLRAAGIDPEL